MQNTAPDAEIKARVWRRSLVTVPEACTDRGVIQMHFSCEVIDFGLAKHFVPGSGSSMKTRAGTPYYVAPQVLRSLVSGIRRWFALWCCLL